MLQICWRFCLLVLVLLNSARVFAVNDPALQHQLSLVRMMLPYGLGGTAQNSDDSDEAFRLLERKYGSVHTASAGGTGRYLETYRVIVMALLDADKMRLVDDENIDWKSVDKLFGKIFTLLSHVAGSVRTHKFKSIVQREQRQELKEFVQSMDRVLVSENSAASTVALAMRGLEMAYLRSDLKMSNERFKLVAQAQERFPNKRARVALVFREVFKFKLMGSGSFYGETESVVNQFINGEITAKEIPRDRYQNMDIEIESLSAKRPGSVEHFDQQISTLLWKFSDESLAIDLRLQAASLYFELIASSSDVAVGYSETDIRAVFNVLKRHNRKMDAGIEVFLRRQAAKILLRSSAAFTPDLGDQNINLPGPIRLGTEIFFYRFQYVKESTKDEEITRTLEALAVAFSNNQRTPESRYYEFLSGCFRVF